MQTKKAKAFAMLVFAATVTGCASDAPKCSDSATLTLVRKLFAVNTGSNFKPTEAELAQVLRIDAPRAAAYDENIKKYTCEATVIVDDRVKMPIRYESQQEDKADHIVALQKFSFRDQGTLSIALYDGLGRLRHQSGGAKPSAPEGGGQAAIAGTWRGNLEGDGNMIIKTATSGYFVSLDVSAPNCSGSIEGTGVLTGNKLKLVKVEDGQTCTITVELAGSQASVAEDNCFSYHGPACGFSGNLSKVN